MDEQELAEIRRTVESAKASLARRGDIGGHYVGWPSVERLLDEVERLRTENTAMQESIKRAYGLLRSSLVRHELEQPWAAEVNAWLDQEA
jgi:hypothetical protein